MGGSHSTSWISGSAEITLTTDCLPDEAADVCLDRHNEAVEEMKLIFPED